MVCSICGAQCAHGTHCPICGTPISASAGTPPYQTPASSANTNAYDPFLPTGTPQPPACGNSPSQGGWNAPPHPPQAPSESAHPYESYSASPGGWNAPPHQQAPGGTAYDAYSASPGGWNAPAYGAPQVTQVCPKCGNLTSGTFCNTCGYAFSPGANTWNQSYAPMGNLPPTKKNNTARNVVIGVGVLYALFIIGIVIFYIFMIFFSFANLAQNGMIHMDGNGGSITLNPWQDESENSNGDSWGGQPEPEPESPQPDTSDPDTQEPQVLPNGVSQKEFDQIEIGMTYLQISAIIGGDGYIANNSGNGDYTVAWPGETDAQAQLNVIFQNGKAVTFEQTGFTED